MSTSSNFVVRLMIEKSLLAPNQASPVVTAGGFEWTMILNRISQSSPSPACLQKHKFLLTCNAPKRGDWECDVNACLALYGDDEPSCKMQATFNNDQREHEPKLWLFFTPNSQGTIQTEFRVSIVKSKFLEHYTPDLACFCSPNESTNVHLLFGQKRLSVSKDFLALHSPVFAAMFYGMFKENGNNEVEIKDVAYEEFVDLLSLLYSRRTKILDSTVCHILELADRFEMKDALYESEAHLKTSEKFCIEEKIQLADRYRLTNLRASPDYELLSAESKDAISNRLKDFN